MAQVEWKHTLELCRGAADVWNVSLSFLYHLIFMTIDFGNTEHEMRGYTYILSYIVVYCHQCLNEDEV